MLIERLRVFLLCSVILTACARPKYVSVNSNGEKNGPLDTSALECTVQFSQSGNCVAWQWEKVPTSKDFGSFVFKVFRPNAFDGTPLETEISPNVVLWMPSMSHTSVPVKITRLDVGTYRAEQIFFVMPGVWEIHFQSLNENGVSSDEAVANYSF
jgi:hypothetical protein